MNKEFKRLIKETKITYQIQFKRNSLKENQQTYRQLLQSKRGEIREVKDCEIELVKKKKKMLHK